MLLRVLQSELNLTKADLTNFPIYGTNSDSPARAYAAQCFYVLELEK